MMIAGCGSGGGESELTADLTITDSHGRVTTGFASGATVQCRLFLTNHTNHDIVEPDSFFVYYMDIYNADGSVALRLENRTGLATTSVTIHPGERKDLGVHEWDQHSTGGPQVANGTYLVRVVGPTGTIDTLIVVGVTS